MLGFLTQPHKFTLLKAFVKVMLLTPLTLTFQVKANTNLPAEIRDHLAALSTSSLMEPAYSLGSLGFSFGISQQRFISQKGSTTDRRSILSMLEPSLANGELQTVHLAKGLSFPLNVGLSVGQLKLQRIYTYAGQLQWTVFEGFRLPSVAIRSSVSQLQGLESLRHQSYQAAVMFDYGVLPYATPYLGYQRSWNQAKLAENNPNLFRLAQTYQPHQAAFSRQQNWQLDEHILGLKLKLPSLFFVISSELHISNTYRSFWLKLGLGT